MREWILGRRGDGSAVGMTKVKEFLELAKTLYHPHPLLDVLCNKLVCSQSLTKQGRARHEVHDGGADRKVSFIAALRAFQKVTINARKYHKPRKITVNQSRLVKFSGFCIIKGEQPRIFQPYNLVSLYNLLTWQLPPLLMIWHIKSRFSTEEVLKFGS